MLFLIGQIGYNKRMIYQVKHKDNCVLSMSSAAKKNTLNAPYNQSKEENERSKTIKRQNKDLVVSVVFMQYSKERLQ